MDVKGAMLPVGKSKDTNSRRLFLSTETVVAQLKEERSRLDLAIDALKGLNSPASSRKAVSAVPHPAPAARKHGALTAAGRKRLSDLMKQRWAERRKKLQSKKRGKE
jgi:hypothetical protein